MQISLLLCRITYTWFDLVASTLPCVMFMKLIHLDRARSSPIFLTCLGCLYCGFVRYPPDQVCSLLHSCSSLYIKLSPRRPPSMFMPLQALQPIRIMVRKVGKVYIGGQLLSLALKNMVWLAFVDSCVLEFASSCSLSAPNYLGSVH